MSHLFLSNTQSVNFTLPPSVTTIAFEEHPSNVQRVASKIQFV